MCIGVRWLSVDDLVELNEYIIRITTPEEPIGVRYETGLASAKEAPALTRWYKQTEDMFLLAAILLSRLIKNHPFYNGNKRTAYLAAQTFLYINGYDLAAPSDEILNLCDGLARDDYTESEVASWLAGYSAQ